MCDNMKQRTPIKVDFRISEEMLQLLKDDAEQKKCSISDILRSIIEKNYATT